MDSQGSEWIHLQYRQHAGLGRLAEDGCALNRTLIAALSIIAIAACIWNFATRDPLGGAAPIRAYEEAIGEAVAAGIRPTDIGPSILVLDSIYRDAKELPSRARGIRSSLERRGVDPAAFHLAYVDRDSMDAQAGIASFPFSKLIEIANAKPDAIAMIVWSDLPRPSSADLDFLRKRPLALYAIPNNGSAARSMVQREELQGALIPRDPIQPVPGGKPDPATRVQAEYEWISAPAGS